MKNPVKAYQLKQGETICFTDEDPVEILAYEYDDESGDVRLGLSDGSFESLYRDSVVEWICGA